MRALRWIGGLLLAGLATWGVLALAATPGPGGPVAPASAARAVSEPAPAPVLEGTPPAPARTEPSALVPPAPPGSPREPGAASRTAVPETPAPPSTAEPKKEDAVAPREEPSAVKPNPRSLPPPPAEKDLDFGANAGPRMTGHRERFAPEPERGPAALTVVVLDAKGLPVKGADVILGPADIVGRCGVSYEHLRVLGQTDAAGRLVDARLPEGRGAVAVEFATLLAGDHGLEALVAQAVRLDRKAPIDLTLRLPFALADLGTVRGTVRGPSGLPVSGAQVSVRYGSATTDASGRFELRHVRAGPAQLVVGATGYAEAREAVTLEPGGVLQRDVALATEEGGNARLSGTLRGPEGETVPGAHVFLGQDFADGGGMTLRAARTDAEGRFEMDSLPDRLRREPTNLIAWAEGYPHTEIALPSGLPTTVFDARFPRRLVRLRLVVVDRETGEAITRCAFAATQPGAKEPCCSFSSRAEDGRFEAWVEAGRLRLTIEAPDHLVQRPDVDVGPGGSTYEHVAAMAPEGAASREVALTVVLVDSLGRPVTSARVEVLASPSRTTLSRLERPQPDGRYLLPAPSGSRLLRVAARDFETHEGPLDLPADAAGREVRVVLRAR